MRRLSRHQADLTQYPTAIRKAKVRDEIDVGDLHGNPARFLYTLIYEGIIELSEAHYHHLCRIVAKPVAEIKPEDIAQFDALLAAAKFHIPKLLRLLGDTLADRGPNDWWTLRIYQALEDHGVPFEVLLSNHDADFIRYMNDEEQLTAEVATRSLQNLKALLARELPGVNKAAVRAMYQAAYLPHLKAMSLGSHAFTASGARALYSHARTGLETLRAAAKVCAVSYCDESYASLQKTLSEVNQFFQQRLSVGDVSLLNLAPRPALNVPLGNCGIAPSNPFLRLTWHRAEYRKADCLDRKVLVPCFDTLKAPRGPTAGQGLASQTPDSLVLKNSSGTARLVNVHGHEGERAHPARPDCFNLDTNLGKRHSTGRYDSYGSHRLSDTDLALDTEDYLLAWLKHPLDVEELSTRLTALPVGAVNRIIEQLLRLPQLSQAALLRDIEPVIVAQRIAALCRGVARWVGRHDSEHSDFVATLPDCLEKRARSFHPAPALRTVVTQVRAAQHLVRGSSRSERERMQPASAGRLPQSSTDLVAVKALPARLSQASERGVTDFARQYQQWFVPFVAVHLKLSASDTVVSKLRCDATGLCLQQMLVLLGVMDRTSLARDRLGLASLLHDLYNEIALHRRGFFQRKPNPLKNRCGGYLPSYKPMALMSDPLGADAGLTADCRQVLTGALSRAEAKLNASKRSLLQRSHNYSLLKRLRSSAAEQKSTPPSAVVLTL